MTSAKGKGDYKTYEQKIDSEMENDGDFCKLTSNINHAPEVETAGSDVNNSKTIFMDADGNYYYQSSDKIVKIDCLTKEPESADKKKFTNKRRAGNIPVSLKKAKVVVSNSKESKDGENDAKSTDRTISSDIGIEEKVYEFDENEQASDDAQNVDGIDYECKGIIKDAKAKEAASFTCMVCPYSTNKRYLLSRHLITHCDERPYKCAVCERGFKSKGSLINHRNTHLGHKPFGCSSCDMAFTTSGELVRHVRYRHTHIKPHKCTECDYCSVELSKLRRHMRCHTGERPYQCPHCTYASPDTFKLKRHLRTHTGEKPYECDICHSRFTQSNSLKHHRLIHSVNDKPVFQCQLCPTTCGRKTDLRLHIKNLHSSDQPLPCKRCGKELPDRYSYKMHIKTHEGEKCYRCEYCPYSSISQRHLESHVFIHLDAKPFVCQICETKFRQKQLLSRHMKIYHSNNFEAPKPRKKDHKCPHCDKLFAFNGNLIRHMEIHDPTSRQYEEKLKLKIGRMKRVKPDGTVVMDTTTGRFSDISYSNEEMYYEETEEQEQQDVKEFQDEYEEPDGEYNEHNIQYIYDEYEAEEYEEQQGEEKYEAVEQESDDKTLLLDVKAEQIVESDVAQTSVKIFTTLKAEDKNESDIMVLEENDDQGFMVIEVLQNDDEEFQEQEEMQQIQSKEVTPPKIINKNANKANINKKLQKNSPALISNYFGFEVNEDEYVEDDDGDDDDTKGVIKLLEMIEED